MTYIIMVRNYKFGSLFVNTINGDGESFGVAVEYPTSEEAEQAIPRITHQIRYGSTYRFVIVKVPVTLNLCRQHDY
jgi:hypothetical protein